MVLLQREIEDERKARLERISQTGVGSLGCGLTAPWIDWFLAETGPRPAEPISFEFGECVHEPSFGLIIGHHQLPKVIIEPDERAERLRLDFCTREWSTEERSLSDAEIFGQKRPSPRRGITLLPKRSLSNERSATAGRSPAQGLRHRELEWKQTHSAELRRYENQWVVLEGEEIVAHDCNAAQAIRQAKSRGIRTPYIFFVEPESDDSVRIGL
jgi:hypothetical protein